MYFSVYFALNIYTCRFTLRFISGYTSSHWLPLSPLNYITAYVTCGMETECSCPYTLSAQTSSYRISAILPFTNYQKHLQTHFNEVKSSSANSCTAICRHFVISCISSWCKNFCLWSVSWLQIYDVLQNSNSFTFTDNVGNNEITQAEQYNNPSKY